MIPPAIDVELNDFSLSDFQKYKLIDIREADELINHPPLVECPHVPLSEFPVNKTIFNQNDKYLLFCAMGGRSHYLAEILTSAGYKAYSVNGGIEAVNAYVQKHNLT